VTGNHSSKPSDYYVQGDVGSGLTDRNRAQRLRYLAKKKGMGLSFTNADHAGAESARPATNTLVCQQTGWLLSA
jgi:hypothetical protein